jgi:hypothetical protein
MYRTIAAKRSGLFLRRSAEPHTEVLSFQQRPHRCIEPVVPNDPAVLIDRLPRPTPELADARSTPPKLRLGGEDRKWKRETLVIVAVR